MIDAVKKSPLASVPAMIVLKRTGRLKCRRRRSRHAALMTVRFEASSKIALAGNRIGKANVPRAARPTEAFTSPNRTGGGCVLAWAISPVSRRSSLEEMEQVPRRDGARFELHEQAAGERPDAHVGHAVRTGELGFGTGGEVAIGGQVFAAEPNATGQVTQNLPRGEQ